MKKKIKIGLIVGAVVIIILFIVMNFSTETVQIVDNESKNNYEIEPAEEISDETDYSTTIKLYFPDSVSGVMSYEERKVDSRKLIDNPYKYIVELLINGPENNNLKNEIPEGTKVNKVYLEKGSLYVDLSEEFLKGSGMNSIYSIVNSLCEFNEIDNVKFLFNGEIKDGFKEKYVKM